MDDDKVTLLEQQVRVLKSALADVERKYEEVRFMPLIHLNFFLLFYVQLRMNAVHRQKSMLKQKKIVEIFFKASCCAVFSFGQLK
jgi:hypothetical protein